MKKYFIFSDVHNNFDALQKALKKAHFNYKDPNHILISLGDLFNKNTQALELYNYLVPLLKQQRLILLQGNHESRLLDLFTKKQNSTFYPKFSTSTMLPTILSLAKIKDINENFDEITLKKILKNAPLIMTFLKGTVAKYLTITDHTKFVKYILSHATFSQASDEIIPDNNTYTPTFIQKAVFKSNYKVCFVFGHFGAFELQYLFNTPTITKEPPYGLKNANNDTLFIYKNKQGVDFVGIDGSNTITNNIPILTLTF